MRFGIDDGAPAATWATDGDDRRGRLSQSLLIDRFERGVATLPGRGSPALGAAMKAFAGATFKRRIELEIPI